MINFQGQLWEPWNRHFPGPSCLPAKAEWQEGTWVRSQEVCIPGLVLALTPWVTVCGWCLFSVSQLFHLYNGENASYFSQGGHEDVWKLMGHIDRRTKSCLSNVLYFVLFSLTQLRNNSKSRWCLLSSYYMPDMCKANIYARSELCCTLHKLSPWTITGLWKRMLLKKGTKIWKLALSYS